MHGMVYYCNLYVSYLFPRRLNPFDFWCYLISLSMFFRILTYGASASISIARSQIIFILEFPAQPWTMYALNFNYPALLYRCWVISCYIIITGLELISSLHSTDYSHSICFSISFTSVTVADADIHEKGCNKFLKKVTFLFMSIDSVGSQHRTCKPRFKSASRTRFHYCTLIKILDWCGLFT